MQGEVVDDELTVGLLSGELDVTLIVGDSHEDFFSVHLVDDPFVLVARYDQFPPGPARIDDVADQPMIGQHPQTFQMLNQNALCAAGVGPNYVFRTNDNGTVAAMVRAGLGVAVVPLLCVEREDPRISVRALRCPSPTAGSRSRDVGTVPSRRPPVAS